MLIKVKLRASNLRTPESRQRPKALLSPMGRPSKPVNDRRQAAPPGRDKKPRTLDAEVSRSSPASSKGSPAPTTRAECSERLPQAVPGHACSLDKAARVLEVRGQSGDRILHLGRRSWLPEGQPWGRLQGAAMARGAWCSNPILPLSTHTTTPRTHPHTHTPAQAPHTHTTLQVTIPQQPLILRLKHKGLAAHYPSASCLAWPREGGGSWPVLRPLHSWRLGTYVGKDFPSKCPR